MSNKQSLSYRISWFKWRFVQYSQIFRVKTIKRRSSGANFIMQILTTEPYFCNPELNRSKLISMFTKLCLKFVCSLSAMSRASAPSFRRNLMITLWSSSIPNVLLTDFKVQAGKIIFKKLHSRIRFDLFNFPKGPHSIDALTWKANSRTQRGRLAHVFMYSTICRYFGIREKKILLYRMSRKK
jgi:hypothetical protein